MSSVIAVTDDSFKEDVLESKLPVLVYFWAAWSAPCRSAGKGLDEIASKYTGRLKVCKLDIDNNPIATNKYGIRSVPVMAMFVQGDKLGALSGVIPPSDLGLFIAKYV